MVMMKEKALGLCSTCIFIDKCTSRKNWKGPVIFCEEFMDYVPTITDKPNAITQDEVQKESTKSEKKEFKGLCINCDNRYECAYAKNEGGVWHCEEYK